MVYVDVPSEYGGEPEGDVGRKRARARWSHMMADTTEELHAMAGRLGLHRRGFRGDHYDVVPTKRAAAIRLGARAVTSRDLVELRRTRRQA